MRDSLPDGITERTPKSVWSKWKVSLIKRAMWMAALVVGVSWLLSGLQGDKLVLMIGFYIFLVLTVVGAWVFDLIRYVDCLACGSAREVFEIHRELKNPRERSCATCGISNVSI